MQIETYEIEEVNNDLAAMAADSEAIELIEKLQLDGQRKLVNGDTATRMPYRRMTKEEEFVFSLLCPVKSSLTAFGSEIIPLRVLQVAAHANDINMFKRLEIWSPELASIKDPVLVGIALPPGQSWGEAIYILARWGKELDPIEKLLAPARKAWTNKMRAAIAKAQASLNADLRMVDATAEFDAIPDKIDPPNYYSIS